MAVVPCAWESQLWASGVSCVADLCKESFHELLIWTNCSLNPCYEDREHEGRIHSMFKLFVLTKWELGFRGQRNGLFKGNPVKDRMEFWVPCSQVSLVSRTSLSGNYRKELAVIVSIPVQQKAYITTCFMKCSLGNIWKLTLQYEGKSSPPVWRVSWKKNNGSPTDNFKDQFKQYHTFVCL